MGAQVQDKPHPPPICRVDALSASTTAESYIDIWRADVAESLEIAKRVNESLGKVASAMYRERWDSMEDGYLG